MTEIKPKLIIIAGPNGSGKTSVTHKILQHDWMEGCVYVNPDNIARDVFGDWNSPEAVLKAASYASQMRENCLSKREGLLFETVLSAPDKVDFIRRAKEADYFVRLFFVGTDSPCTGYLTHPPVFWGLSDQKFHPPTDLFHPGGLSLFFKIIHGDHQIDFLSKYTIHKQPNISRSHIPTIFSPYSFCSSSKEMRVSSNKSRTNSCDAARQELPSM